MLTFGGNVRLRLLIQLGDADANHRITTLFGCPSAIYLFGDRTSDLSASSRQVGGQLFTTPQRRCVSLSRCKHGPGHSTRRSADDSIKSSGYFSSVFVGLIRLSLMRIKRLQLTEGVGARFKLDFLKPEPRRNTRSPSSCSSLLFSTTMLSI